MYLSGKSSDKCVLIQASWNNLSCTNCYIRAAVHWSCMNEPHIYLSWRDICSLNNSRMLDINLDETAIATTVLGNILLSFSIHLQKYAKRKIIHLALHGADRVSLKRVWKVGLSLLVMAECFYFIAIGLFSGKDELSALTVFTMVSNIVLPPLFYEHHEHTICGSLLSQFGILLLIMTKHTIPSGTVRFNWDDNLTKVAVTLELILGIAFAIVRSFQPRSCSLKIFSNCGISSLMGSHVATAVRAMSVLPGSDRAQPILAAIVLISFILELVLVSESLKFFSAFQVVPHHFSMLMAVSHFNKMTIFRGVDEYTVFELTAVSSAYAFITWGVWVAARPHLDVPVNISETGLLPEMQRRVMSRLVAAASTNANEHLQFNGSQNCQNCPLDTMWGRASLCEEFCHIVDRTSGVNEGPIAFV